MSRWFPILLAAACNLGVASCSDRRDAARSLVSPDQQGFVRDAVIAFQSGDLERVKPLLSAGVDIAALTQAFPSLAARVRHGDLLRVDPIGYSSTHSGRLTLSELKPDEAVQTRVVYELTFKDGAQTVMTADLVEWKTGRGLYGAAFQDADEVRRLGKVGGPTPAGAAGMLFVLLLVAIPAFTLATAWRCYRDRPWRWWLWELFILVTFGVVELNWGTGQFRLSLDHALVLGGGFLNPEYEPTQLFVGVPLGALAYWIFRQLRSQKSPEVSLPSLLT